MQDLLKIRFLTINFSNLQGLKAVPLGLLLLAVVLWANSLSYPARNFLVPVTAALGAVALYALIERYYRRHYGKVERTARQIRLEVIIGIIGGILGLAAVLVDLTRSLSVSLVGLVFALAFPAEYLRIFRLEKAPYYLWQTSAGFIIVLGATLLPVFGLSGWWQELGLRSNLMAVLVVTSIVMVISGLCGHAYFTRQFPPKEA
jgi:uncharacterized membrane protein